MLSAISKAELETIFRNIFNGGVMDRLPKSRRNADAFLALAAASLDSQKVFTEAELNTRLAEWMASFTNPRHLDHVTVRRYLVDLSMLLRDPEGKSYRTNQTVISRHITPEARAVHPNGLLDQVEAARLLRRRQTKCQL
ncbi:MAG: hypothetical protein ACJAYE_001147 [Candidatus Azotimanducaceae bacterium]